MAFKDLQTEADRSTQRCIISSLQKQFPKVQIFGEEVAVFTVRLHIHRIISVSLSGVI